MDAAIAVKPAAPAKAGIGIEPMVCLISAG
jgi:hypothetical protein